MNNLWVLVGGEVVEQQEEGQRDGDGDEDPRDDRGPDGHRVSPERQEELPGQLYRNLYSLYPAA